MPFDYPQVPSLPRHRKSALKETRVFGLTQPRMEVRDEWNAAYPRYVDTGYNITLYWIRLCKKRTAQKLGSRALLAAVVLAIAWTCVGTICR